MYNIQASILTVSVVLFFRRPSIKRGGVGVNRDVVCCSVPRACACACSKLKQREKRYAKVQEIERREEARKEERKWKANNYSA